MQICYKLALNMDLEAIVFALILVEIKHQPRLFQNEEGDVSTPCSGKCAWHVRNLEKKELIARPQGEERMLAKPPLRNNGTVKSPLIELLNFHCGSLKNISIFK